MSQLSSGAADGRRIPSLDGLRAISILAVVLGHAGGTHGFPAWAEGIVVNDRFDAANFGVRVFFVISGFLITGLLLDEHRRHGAVSLARFYFRRTFRIVPAYLAYLAGVTALGAAGLATVTGADLFHALTWTVNYHEGRSWVVGHLWSLAVEEQFYLIWPFVIAAAGLVRGRTAAALTVAVVPLIRVAESMLFPAYRPLIGTAFETTADALAIGCLLALWRDTLEARPGYLRLLASRWLVPLLLGAGIVAGLRYRPLLLLGLPLQNLAIALLVHRAVRFPASGLGTVLNLAPVAWFGTLSYSLYLWQQLFLDRTAPVTHAWTHFPANLVLAMVAAIASYRLVERPMLQARGRLERRLFAPRAASSAVDAPATGPVTR